MPEFMQLELHTYDEGWIQRKGGVAWVKQVAAAMDPGAVGLQITGYQQAAEQIAYAQKAVKASCRSRPAHYAHRTRCYVPLCAVERGPW